LENGTVDSASFELEDEALVRTTILSLPHKIVSFTFFPNKTGFVEVAFTFTNHSIKVVGLEVNSVPSSEPFVKVESLSDSEAGGQLKVENWEVPDLVDLELDKDYSKVINNIMKSVDNVDMSEQAKIYDSSNIELVKLGLLTEKGRWVKLGQYIDHEKSAHDHIGIPQRGLKAIEKIPQRRLLDTFAGSIHHVNKIFTSQFGKAQRKVLSHMPFLVNKTILNDLHSRLVI
jgi:hypothetical protein